MVQLFRKVLCPIDFSDQSVAVLNFALKVTQQNDAKLYLLNVAPMPAGAAGFQPVPMDAYPFHEEDRKQELAELARERIPAAVRCETLVISGDPAARVLETARGLAADLIVMGTYGHRGLSRLILGSVAEAGRARISGTSSDRPCDCARSKNFQLRTTLMVDPVRERET